MNRRYDILKSPIFLLSILLLLINDFYLKQQFGNDITGKLSDFAGLFAFSLFWMALFPGYRDLTGALIALFYAFWKSPWSQGAIDWWNGWDVFEIGRVVDFTDLMALVTLPLAILYVRRPSWPQIKMPTTVPVALAAFAFIATSKAQHFANFGQTYTLDQSVESLVWTLDSSGQSFTWDHHTELSDSTGNTYSIQFIYSTAICAECTAQAKTVAIRESDSTTTLVLDIIIVMGNGSDKLDESNDPQLRNEFEAVVLNEL